MFMNRKIVAKHEFRLQKLNRPVMVRNVDSTNNSTETITHQIKVDIYYKNHIKRMRIDICNLKKIDVILEMPWLQMYNSKINWKTEEVKIIKYLSICRRNTAVKKNVEQKKKIGKRIRVVDQVNRDEQKQTMKEKFDDEVELNREKVKKMVLQKFHKQLKVFEKAELERIPVRKPWDYVINLKEDFVPRKRRTYLILREKKEEVREFVEEQLRKRYIQPLKSFQTLLVFFVEKKDRKKRIVQDYRYLNKGMVKDNYPLSLISDLINTKKDIYKDGFKQGYNNIQIKERNEQKIMFTTYLGVYEPTVMFFGLTNSPAIFQVIMNNILRDLIDTGDIVVFMDNILVGTKNEKKHNEIVKKIPRKIEANDLYLKSEKCMQKVKEISFLELVMGTDGIKMQEEKMLGVLE